ncbi:MAG: DNA-binding protein [Clostridia bacterium]|nr:DNA-binding protein [Clostridia bacterium]MBR1585461.1 DNA-binding protein [Clostridia bacterium]
MDYRHFGNTYVIRMDRGEEVLSTLTALCEKEHILLASVQALGAADRAVVCVYDVKEKVFHRQTLTGPMEIASLIGTVTQQDGKPYLHLHVTLCDEHLIAHGGHANEITLSATCEMVLTVIDGQVGRVLDPDIGLNVFQF